MIAGRTIGIAARAGALLGALSLLATSPSEAAEVQTADAVVAECRLVIEGHSITSLVLQNDSGGFFPFSDPPKELPLPAGRYQVLNVTVDDRYHAVASGEPDRFTLSPDRPHHLKVGAPLRPSVEAARSGSRIQLDYGVVDAAGRPYAGSRGPEAPEFSVLRDGREIGSGSFEYG
jgi:hypothetical protein